MTSDRRTPLAALLALLVMLIGAVLMISADQYQLAIPAVVLMAVGMGVANAAVFKIVGS